MLQRRNESALIQDFLHLLRQLGAAVTLSAHRDRPVLEVERQFLAGLHAIDQSLADNDRQPDVNRIPEEDARKAVGKHGAHAERL